MDTDPFDALLAKHGVKYNSGRGDVGRGWYPILDEMFTRLIAEGWNREVAQVKEKFGLLRVYLGESTEAMRAIVDEAEDKSSKVCETCGAPGRQTGKGWIVTACTSCRPDA